MSQSIYNRILLKLGGESLAGPAGFGIDVSEAEAIASHPDPGKGQRPKTTGT